MSNLNNDLLLESLYEQVIEENPNLSESEQIELTKQLFEDMIQWSMNQKLRLSSFIMQWHYILMTASHLKNLQLSWRIWEMRTSKETRVILSPKDRAYLKIETSYRDLAYIYFSMIEQDFRLLNKPMWQLSKCLQIV